MLVAAQPTRGLDVGAIEFVHRRLRRRARRAAAAILLVSLELEEVRSLADRILVIYEGGIVGEFPPDASEEELGHRDDRRRARGAGGVSGPEREPRRPALAGEPGPEARRARPRPRGWRPTCRAAASSSRC